MIIDKIALITKRLQDAFQLTYLEVVDESDKHIGHPGHQGGGRHFAIVIGAECLNGLSRVTAHRQVYALFNDLMPDQIHALRIAIVNPDDHHAVIPRTSRGTTAG